MKISHDPQGVKIARVGTLPTKGRLGLTPAVAKVYAAIGDEPPTTTLDLLKGIVALTTHAAIVQAQPETYSEACRLGVSQTLWDSLAVLAGRRASNSFELAQKALAADIIPDQNTALYWALHTSLHADARVIFPGSSREQIECWIGWLREQKTMN